jgi:hydroxyacylglutathione hydrolase
VPAIQVHKAAENTVILRQSMAESYEAPFLYLLLGEDRALLLDTGATTDASTFPLRVTIDALIEAWLVQHPKEGYELIVAHSHAHGDHVAADTQFADRALTQVVGHSVEEVFEFFGVNDRPNGYAELDLGGRKIQVIPTPGHHATAITIYDDSTGALLTGDTVYPGRLYAADFSAFESSLRTLCAFSQRYPVKAVLGAHIEMSKQPGRDFPLGSTWHPDEAALAMTAQDLHAIKDAAVQVAHRPGAHRFANFIIWNGPCRWEAAVQRARRFTFRVFGR